MLYRELNTVGGYLSPFCGGEKVTSTQFFLIMTIPLAHHCKIPLSMRNVVIPLTHHKNSGYTELKVLGVWRSIILIPIWLCIVPPPKAGEQYERTAILYHQQYTSKLGVINEEKLS